ncbi:hypothetical protein H3S87_06730 [Bifidobacterium sp. W8108]|uniref:hypothetical protein n=1 Tax=unclassified Bifidobacterium TaxID=2608897 RepID=UPI0018DD5B89|nr:MULTISPECIES: hypothetical protein [unclassified Bifidobacterium]MBH9979344.1 hypothetical protein [Bifidobacterium sp. W8108]MBI0172784.1 hypothetical protein [Bifidobacterium sp. M0307]
MNNDSTMDPQNINAGANDAQGLTDSGSVPATTPNLEAEQQHASSVESGGQVSDDAYTWDCLPASEGEGARLDAVAADSRPAAVQAGSMPTPPPVNSRPTAPQGEPRVGAPQAKAPQAGSNVSGPHAASRPAVPQGQGRPAAMPHTAPVGAQPQPGYPQVAQPGGQRFQGPQNGAAPAPFVPNAARPAYPAPGPYPAQAPYMAQNPYMGQPQQVAPPADQESKGASGLAITSLVLSLTCWPIALFVAPISVFTAKNKASKRLSQVASALCLVWLLILIFVVWGLVTMDKEHRKQISEKTSESNSQSLYDDSSSELTSDDDWESGLQYSEHTEVEPICDLSNGLEFAA